MTVYVDEITNCNPQQNKKWPYKKACHMTADSEEELHMFAAKLGLKRAWFQNKHRNPVMWHYDLTESKRRLAVQLGAKELTWREAGKRINDAIRHNHGQDDRLNIDVPSQEKGACSHE